MKISVRLEGGLGDFILGNRFVPAIKELFPDSEITAFCDTEGAKFQAEMLKSCFSHFYKDIVIISSKKENEHIISTSFGRENYRSHLRNVPDKFTDSMLEDYDKFYDLHIDSLAFLSYEFDWFKYHRFFPTPVLKETVDKPFGRYIVANLYTNLSNCHEMDEDYVRALLQSLLNGMPVVCIVNKETKDLYEAVTKQSDRCKFFEGNVSQIAGLIKDSAGFVGVDSGFKYFAYSYSRPTLTYTKYSPEPHKVMFSHKLRWLPFENDCIPPNFDLNYSLNYFSRMINSKVFWIKPDIQDLKSEIVDRFGYSIERR